MDLNQNVIEKTKVIQKTDENKPSKIETDRATISLGDLQPLTLRVCR